MDHSFNVEIASEYGIEEAIILNNLYYWIEKNKANEKHFYDGEYWTYNSQQAMTKLFPYLNRSKIQRIISKLRDNSLINTGNYNTVAYDHTTWFSLTDKGKELFNLKQSDVKNKTVDCLNLNNQMCENEQPIPDSNNKYNNKYNQNNNDKSLLQNEGKEIFEIFRNVYPGTKRGLETEFINFTKKHKDWGVIINLLLPAIKKEIDCRKSYTDNSKFYPQQKNLQTWINQKSWEQELVFNEVVHKTELKPLTDITFTDVELFAVELIRDNKAIQEDNFNKVACKYELNNYFKFVKEKNIENWKNVIRSMFNKNVNKFIYA